jgi:hypothetical protein
MLGRDEVAAGFVEHARRSASAEELPEERWAGLADDADALGLFGLLAALAADPEPRIDEGVRLELVEPVNRDLRDALGEQDEVDLPTRFERFSRAKGARAADLAARVVARVAHEVYDLRQHRLTHEDALLACDLMAWGGPGVDARETAKRLCRLSRHAARAVLGHLSEQLALVHALGQEEQVAWTEVDGRLHEFAPRIFAQRLPSMLRFLLADEPRLRFAFVLWGRLRGVVLSRAGIQGIAEKVQAEKPMTLIRALDERRPARVALRLADQMAPLAREVERVFLARVLPPPPSATKR